MRASSEVGDRDGDKGRLGVDRQIQLLRRPLEGQAADRLAKGVVGFGQDGRRCRRGLGQGFAHAHGLGSLAGEYESDAIHVLFLVSFDVPGRGRSST